MLREEQINLRKQRARQANFDIRKRGKNRIFSEFEVRNPDTGMQYTVTVRGFDLGDNSCTCPDYRTNTLGTCKHIEAVLAKLEDEVPEQFYHRKATIKHPEIYLHYGQQLRLRLLLPRQHSDQLAQLARTFFDEQGYAQPTIDYAALIAEVQKVPEQIKILSDALEFIDREQERAALAQRERLLLAQLDAGQMPAEMVNLVRVRLYDYQLRGAVFLACRCRSILGDDMGLGKTIQAIAAVELLARLRDLSRVLVITPASVKYQWESELRRLIDRPVQVIDGRKKERRKLYEQETFYRLANYEQVVRETDYFIAWQPDLIILDEAQRIKNWESATSRAVKRLPSRYCIVLTGTPLENKLEELYSIVQFVDGRRLGPAFEFLHEHRVLDGEGHLIGYRHLDRIRERLAPILLRRTRAEVLSQLPPRTDKHLSVELTAEQRAQYDKQQAALAQLLNKQHLSELDHQRILACIANLRMVCNSTFLLDKQTRHSSKLEEFAELMLELRDAGTSKVVVFSQWETMLHEAAQVLQRLQIGHAMLHGNVPTHQRRELIEHFHTDPICRVFLSTDAGSTGLNLQCADTVVHLELPWNPAVLEQRIARVHRLGQPSPVRVIYLIARGTIEERVQRTLAQKGELFTGLFQDGCDRVDFSTTSPSQLIPELRLLLAPDQPPATPATDPTKPPATTTAHERLLVACVQSVEALADVVEWHGELPAELAVRLHQAIDRLQRALRVQAPTGAERSAAASTEAAG
jgi:SNF2 family DNA or RNA helicase